MIDEYNTIADKTEFEFKEKGSKFIGIGFPVSSTSEVETILKENAKIFYDATHNCYAYRLGIDGNQFRYSDAGEPNGTAGKPILGAIDNHKVTDILIIVNRYFGGKKLGVSGLFNAYFTCAENVIKNSNPITKIINEKLIFTIEHPLINLIMRSIASFNAKIIKQEYGEKANFEVEVRKSKYIEFKEFLTNATNARITFFEP
jgi:uncharacterized YigZ family protein